MQGHISQVRVGLWKSRKKREGFKGSKQNIMRKRGEKKENAGWFAGTELRSGFSHKDLVRNTHTFKQHTLMSTSGFHSVLSKKSNILPLM